MSAPSSYKHFMGKQYNKRKKLILCTITTIYIKFPAHKIIKNIIVEMNLKTNYNNLFF